MILFKYLLLHFSDAQFDAGSQHHVQSQRHGQRDHPLQHDDQCRLERGVQRQHGRGGGESSEGEEKRRISCKFCAQQLSMNTFNSFSI